MILKCILSGGITSQTKSCERFDHFTFFERVTFDNYPGKFAELAPGGGGGGLRQFSSFLIPPPPLQVSIKFYRVGVFLCIPNLSDKLHKAYLPSKRKHYFFSGSIFLNPTNTPKYVPASRLMSLFFFKTPMSV